MAVASLRAPGNHAIAGASLERSPEMRAKLEVVVMCFVVLALAAGAAVAQNQDCSCTGISPTATGCGNNAIGGDQGDIFTNITPADVAKYFTANPNTGWTCLVPSKTRGKGGPLGCFCQKYCGNGGIGANPGTFDLGLNQAKINQGYGGGKAGNPTGWLCGNYRGSFDPAKAKVKE
jgi:hypothetical protein